MPRSERTLLWTLTLLVLIAGTAGAAEFQLKGRKSRPAPANSERFSPLEGFAVEEVVAPGATGSLVNMAFNERGDVIASREGGPLLLIQDKDHDGKFETVGTYCDKVKNCHGILVLEGQTLIVGDGPGGTGLYRLSDYDNEGAAQKVELLFKFRGSMGEHGPHAAVLGPDGMVYVMIGNHAFIEKKPDATSPHHNFYDGELITPKYEDANGHAAGIKAPGGTIVRTDANGSFQELFLGGFRNAFDFACSRGGEFFTFDSDMEWDVALPWYRPTRVNHCVAGAEFGWRSGWSKWPDYYLDTLGSSIDIGRGSPTGMEFYDHSRLGAKYKGALFMCDWSQGRILAVTLKPHGATFVGASEIFLEGRPLNCSDIAVGPDGWLYFCVGGRGTQGSLFRIVSTQEQTAPINPEQGLAKALHQPQLYSAWGRAAIAKVKRELGDAWAAGLTAVAQDTKAPAADRTTALTLLQLFGPAPDEALLAKLARDGQPDMRGRAAYLLGLHKAGSDNSPTAAALTRLIDDPDAPVRRVAFESAVRSQAGLPLARVLAHLADPDRNVAWAARRTLERMPPDQWHAAVLGADNPRQFLVGAVAIVTMQAEKATYEQILARAEKLLASGILSPDDLVDLLRVVELACYRAQTKGDDVTGLRSQLSQRYPTSDWRANRELVRLLVYLQEPTLAPRLVAHLESEAPLPERIHVAMTARFLQPGWTPELRSQYMTFSASARRQEGGNSYRGYLTNAANDLLRSAPMAEQLAAIAAGARQPGLALAYVDALSGPLTSEHLASLRKLDIELASSKGAAERDLAKAILAALARGDETTLAYLREVFENSPERRPDVAQSLAALALARQPKPVDAALLARSLTAVEGNTAREVLRALAKLPKPEVKPEQVRQVILLGLKLQDQGGREAAALLEHWTGRKQNTRNAEVSLAAWQKWFAETYPKLPEAVLPVEAAGNKWTYSQLLDFLASEKGASGSVERGAAVFEKSQCIKCHRYGTRGEGIGPDLSNVSSRFQRKEVLESVIFPSQVISDQFAAKTVITNDGLQYTGIVGPAADGVVVLQANAEKVKVLKTDIDMIVESKKSAMPEGLFNTLTLEEIADLFAYLSKPPAAK